MLDITHRGTLWNAVHLVLLRVVRGWGKKKRSKGFGSNNSLKVAISTEKEMGNETCWETGCKDVNSMALKTTTFW